MWPTQQPAATERCSAYLLFSFSNKLKQTKKKSAWREFNAVKRCIAPQPGASFSMLRVFFSAKNYLSFFGVMYMLVLKPVHS